MALRLIIAEDNDLYRETLGQMLVSLDGLYTLVGEADNGVDESPRRRNMRRIC